MLRASEVCKNCFGSVETRESSDWYLGVYYTLLYLEVLRISDTTDWSGPHANGNDNVAAAHLYHPESM
eukprot:1195809-Prorocentrum_minimum.AAC.5